MIQNEAVAHDQLLAEVIDALLADNLRRFEEGMESIAQLCETEPSEQWAEDALALAQAA